MPRTKKSISKSLKKKIDAYSGILEMLDVYNSNKISYEDFIEEIMPLAKNICAKEDDYRRLLFNIENHAKCRDKSGEHYDRASQDFGHKIYKTIFAEILKDQKLLINELNKKN